MTSECMLIRAERNLTTVRYFVNQVDADAYLAGYDAPVKPAAKREKKSNLKAITRLPHALITQTKPAPGLPKKKEPLAVRYPDRYRHSSFPWIDHRAVSVPFVRMGSQEWRDGVGGAV